MEEQNSALWYTEMVHYGQCPSPIKNPGNTSQSFPVLFQPVTPFIRALFILLLEQELVLIL